MSLYPEIDQRSLEELIGFFEGPPVDGPGTAVAFYQEVADKIAETGSDGLDYLWRATATADSARLRALALALSRHSSEAQRLRSWLRSLLKGSADVVAEAIDGLARSGDTGAKPLVAAMAQDPSEFVRGAVVRFVCALSPEEAWPSLERAALDPHFVVRENAADEMGDLGDPRALPLLERLVADPHPHVRQAAQSALDALRGIGE